MPPIGNLLASSLYNLTEHSRPGLRHMEDLAIIERVCAGDRDAFTLLVERHQSAIFRTVRNLLPDAVECEDLAQDVFLTAFNKLAAFDPGRASFRTWLLTIARNRCLNA